MKKNHVDMYFGTYRDADRHAEEMDYYLDTQEEVSKTVLRNYLGGARPRSYYSDYDYYEAA